ncbi:hypothetical protein [Thioclava kandeliae]|uniref:TnsA endonuclease N-terminal domain-containing protein n=1 Tax=Thioclava kandeliae TaxID=3070818 RepID=A0ABV1SIU0_9RHOB
MMSLFNTIEHENAQYALPRMRAASKITFGDIHGVLPFSGTRNPISVSNTSYKAAFLYKTAANSWKPRLGLVESGAELAVAEEILLNPDLYDLEFQPEVVRYRHPDGSDRTHYPDLRQTFHNGFRRLIFVRNASSLRKPSTKAEIQAIIAATPPSMAHAFTVIDADSYSRPRRENLRRMHRLVAFQPDAKADELVEDLILSHGRYWLMSELFPNADLPKWRIFQSCLRLIATGKLMANMNAVISHHSHIWRPSA